MMTSNGPAEPRTSPSAEESEAPAAEEAPLYALLSTAADACRRGCAVIRRVHAKRVQKVGGGGGGGPEANGGGSASASAEGNGGAGAGAAAAAMSVEYKVSGDPRSALTEADGASQRVILDCLRSRWGDRLKIIGEEDEEGSDDDGETRKDAAAGASEGKKKGKGGDGGGDDDKEDDVFAKYGVPAPSDEPLREDLIVSPPPSGESEGGKEDEEEGGSPAKRPKIPPPTLPLSDVVVYVDPMDGTREFVEGRLRNVQCLIGFTYKGVPVAGIVGLPFADEARAAGGGDGDRGCGVEVIYGVAAESSTALGRLGVRADGSEGCEWSNLPFLPSAGPPASSENGGSAADGGPAADDGGGGGAEEEEELLVLSGDSAKPDLVAATSALESVVSSSSSGDDAKGAGAAAAERGKINCVVAGGCGNKILRVALSAAAPSPGGREKNSLAVVPRGTCSWDTAAPTAILKAVWKTYGREGHVTDFFGKDLVYDGTETNVHNTRGALLSAGSKASKWHDQLCGKLRELGDAIYEKKKKE